MMGVPQEMTGVVVKDMMAPGPFRESQEIFTNGLIGSHPRIPNRLTKGSLPGEGSSEGRIPRTLGQRRRANTRPFCMVSSGCFG